MGKIEHLIKPKKNIKVEVEFSDKFFRALEYTERLPHNRTRTRHDILGIGCMVAELCSLVCKLIGVGGCAHQRSVMGERNL